MLDLIANGMAYILPDGRVIKLVKNGVKIPNSTNPLILTKNITLTVVEYCSPPYVY